MSHEKNIIKKINDASLWPTFQRPSFLNDLNALADEAYSKKSIDGYLAALLIYHQLCEEMVKVLIECSDFFIQCAIYPAKIRLRKTKRQMFGHLLVLLEQGIQNDGIEKFTEKSKKLNNIRIRMVHKITLKSSIKDIKRQIKPAKRLFDEIYFLFNKIYDNYRVIFNDLRKDMIDLANNS